MRRFRDFKLYNKIRRLDLKWILHFHSRKSVSEKQEKRNEKPCVALVRKWRGDWSSFDTSLMTPARSWNPRTWMKRSWNPCTCIKSRSTPAPLSHGVGSLHLYQEEMHPCTFIPRSWIPAPVSQGDEPLHLYPKELDPCTCITRRCTPAPVSPEVGTLHLYHEEMHPCTCITRSWNPAQ